MIWDDIHRASTLGRALTLGAALVALAPAAAGAQEEEEEDDAPSFEDKIEGLRAIEGFFDFYQDDETGELMMAVRADQLDREFVYFNMVTDAPIEASSFRGQYGTNAVFVLRKNFDKIDVVHVNTGYYFDPEDALSRAADANISDALIDAIKIEATGSEALPLPPSPAAVEGEEAAAAAEDGDAPESEEVEVYLIKASDFFESTKLARLEPLTPPNAKPGEFFDLGALSDGKTRVSAVRGYPDNVDVLVDYHFENKAPRNFGTGATADARYTRISMQHSFVKMPEEPFTPRLEDYRVGYFSDRVTDLTSDSPTPYRDIANRWRLEKKDPDADVSDPVEPIVWWIENTTPVEFRDTIRDATLAWNEAFLAAGFSNAMEVRVQPDDADWDAGDVRYNVLRWTSSPTPPFGGYGPSISNPRTGELIASDIMLEASFILNRRTFGDIFDTAALGEPASLSPGADPAGEGRLACTAGHELHHELMFGLAAAYAQGASEEEIARIEKEGVYYLILHELGHTLGLNHNMKASQLHGLDDIHDESVTQGIMAGSVMDYPPINIAPEGVEQGGYNQTRPGPYDVWAIQFGYDPDLDDPAAMKAHLARSLEPALAFGNDADDMRSPGKATDPRVNTRDLTSDAIGYGVQRIGIIQDVMPKLVDKLARDGESWQRVRDAYLILTGQHSRSADVISRYIGGVYVERADSDQPNAGRPYTPVAYGDQKRAMQALADHVFAPDAFALTEELASHLQAQRRQYDFFAEPEAPSLHARIENIQSSVLAHLLHPNVLRRLTDSRLYGNEYSTAEMLGDLTDAIMTGDAGTPNTVRQNLQIAYANGLVGVVSDTGGVDSVARSAALSQLMRIETMSRPKLFGGDAELEAHQAHLRLIVDKAIG